MATINSRIIKSKIFERGENIITVSEKIGVNSQTLSNWINGKNLKQIEKFIDLLILLEIDLKDLKK